MLQVTAELGGSSNESFEHALRKVCIWLQRSKKLQLPEGAWTGQPFEYDAISALRVEAVRLDNPEIWALRFDDPDKVVPQRTWITEIALARPDVGATALFGLRLTCASHQGGPRTLRTIPSVLRHITRAPGLYECGWRLGEKATRVEGEFEAEALVELLGHPGRRRPVLAFSIGDDPSAVFRRADEVAAMTPGASHIVTVDESASWLLTERLGRERSVFGGAIRTYMPGFNTEGDPYRHPLMLAGRQRQIEIEMSIAARERRDDPAQIPLDMRLAQNALAASTLHNDWREALPPFAEIKRMALREHRQTLETTNPEAREAIQERLREEIDILEAKSAEDQRAADQLLDELQRERDEAVQVAETLRADVFRLNAHIQALKARPDMPDDEAGIPEHPPQDYQMLFTWADQYLKDRISISTKALRAAKGAPTEQLARSWQALRILAIQYKRMRRGDDGALSAFEHALRQAGLEDAPVAADEASLGPYAEQYMVILDDGRRFKLDKHLKRGNSREDRHCFRLYYTWDDEAERVIIGPFPGHLPNSHS